MNNWSRCGILFLLVLIFGCREQEQKVVDVNEILPSSKKSAEDRAELSDQIDSSAMLFERFEGHLPALQKVEKIEKRGFLDRFGPQSSEQWKLTIDDLEFKYHRWNYADSSKLMNAFFNWIDCFGEDCYSSFVGEEKNFQSDPFYLFVNDTSIVFVESLANFKKEYWLDFLEHEGFEKEWKLILAQKKEGKVNWSSMTDGQEEQLEIK